MSRSSRLALDRRTLLATAAAGAAAGLGSGLGLTAGTATAGQPATARAVPGARPLAPRGTAATPSVSGTTLEAVSAPRGDGSGEGYLRLERGAAWQRVVRTELASASGGREDRRTALASFVQFTDLHIVDVQHPLRYEYLRTETSSAWRPQEALSVAGAVSLVERVNGLKGGPATGAPLSFVVTTGDNTDNNSRAELEWFLTVMSGGRITPNTGDPRRYEGVQNSGLKLYWHPDDTLRDDDKALGFPALDGFLQAAIREVNSPGLTLPWYSTVGNHDLLPGGCYASGDSFFGEFSVGGRKLMELASEKEGEQLWKTVKEGGDPKGELFRELLRSRKREMRPVTADEKRAPFTREEYLRAHLRPEFRGAGPVGHGYTEESVAEDRLYYTFRISEDVVGISLDTTRPDGHFEGRVGTEQLRWLERQLRRHEDGYVLLFSHHTSSTTPEGGPEVVDLLRRNPHVLAWINGHSHKNAITPRETFWEISTASHIDFPQLARIVEVTDNKDGTLSLFTSLVESAAPHGTDFEDLSQTGLAALYRELSFNAPGARDTLAGEPGDRNTELLLPKR
ncbi:TIGR03767 family metallophosphoesterase [Streptomyces sp. HNM0574]|uniref:TIGR03767 family metallophosphoesterase n=1 Tax=Streptomyces sp. HNM0574 TaxID=2714954 RepID=UPI00146A235F|nr:TIGR03767 family metallophosphoesterase [Streptomyces sp. HNM0574]NLU66397.1 TIGR03767 family metallophosphoesterase [Streptomyces sp. HNM0574]